MEEKLFIKHGIEMPKFLCHKTVWALKIKDIEGDLFIPEDERYTPFRVGQPFMGKHLPEPGGYYVVYDDNYASYSPAAAFENGYTLIGTEKE